ncbi:DUF2382 domain-containing protein [Amnibacterium sp. CER49]|uniref:DUF2382 domain-containing protein n=1 Tax=Amnibacterium sp. CER49 TaxID=3039161 RepID=UPI00244BE98D|nr:DUF2382 domain-containing protein [Amnibacterium sp. CER49]MDH2443043.1 DUF2382 domain-containing protein [Amnibacterium sp. CER49]
MIATRDIDRIIGSEAVDSDNDKIGKVSQVYIDSDTEQPTWASVKTGLFGTHETLVPLDNANWDDDVLHVAVDKAQVKDAPRVDPDAEISPEEQERLYEFYGVHNHGGSSFGGGTTGSTTDAGTTTTVGGADRGTMNRGTTDRGTTGLGDSYDRSRTGADDTAYDSDGTTGGFAGGSAGFDRGTDRGADFDRDATDRNRAGGYDTSGPTTDDAMTRSEQRLNVGTEQTQAGRARLRKYVVTEQQSVNVPVSREEVRLDREPITDANRGDAYDGPELSGEEHEVVLNEERPVVNKETVPVERVRLSKEQVTENRQVTEDVAHEEIETDGDGIGGNAGRGDRL